MNYAKEFTLSKGLEIQQENLKLWENKLNTECFTALKNYCLVENSKLNSLSSGYQVARGDKLVSFINNWKPSTQNKEERFLNLLGYDTSFGYYQSDVDEYAVKCPELYNHVVKGEPLII
jgi:hypothetical protein|tara:strand:+ start:15036 stop:15392 length:357 start_codon:yes stop_codon:yes gene_type:complete